jgi:hypothetical protein
MYVCVDFEHDYRTHRWDTQSNRHDRHTGSRSKTMHQDMQEECKTKEDSEGRDERDVKENT